MRIICIYVKQGFETERGKRGGEGEERRERVRGRERGERERESQRERETEGELKRANERESGGERLLISSLRIVVYRPGFNSPSR